MNKKDIPYELLVAVEEILRENKELIRVKNENNCFYSIADRDQQSKFYFKIYTDPTTGNVNKPDSPVKVLCEYYPANLSFNTTNKIHLLPRDVKTNLFKWIDHISKYNHIESVYDDPILRSYEKYYYDKFQIVDEDSDVVPFDPEKQDRLEKYLIYMQKKFLHYHPHSEEEKQVVEEIVEDTKELQQDLQKLTKKETIGRITKIWAKVHKWSRKHGKEIVKKASEELMKELVKAGVKYLTTGHF